MVEITVALTNINIPSPVQPNRYEPFSIDIEILETVENPGACFAIVSGPGQVILLSRGKLYRVPRKGEGGACPYLPGAYSPGTQTVSGKIKFTAEGEYRLLVAAGYLKYVNGKPVFYITDESEVTITVSSEIAPSPPAEGPAAPAIPWWLIAVPAAAAAAVAAAVVVFRK